MGAYLIGRLNLLVYWPPQVTWMLRADPWQGLVSDSWAFGTGFCSRSVDGLCGVPTADPEDFDGGLFDGRQTCLFTCWLGERLLFWAWVSRIWSNKSSELQSAGESVSAMKSPSEGREIDKLSSGSILYKLSVESVEIRSSAICDFPTTNSRAKMSINMRIYILGIAASGIYLAFRLQYIAKSATTHLFDLLFMTIIKSNVQLSFVTSLTRSKVRRAWISHVWEHKIRSGVSSWMNCTRGCLGFKNLITFCIFLPLVAIKVQSTFTTGYISQFLFFCYVNQIDFEGIYLSFISGFLFLRLCESCAQTPATSNPSGQSSLNGRRNRPFHAWGRGR